MNLPTADQFVPQLFSVIHNQFHDAFEGEPHEEQDVINYFRGWLHGLRFGAEYRKWARVVAHICFQSDEAQRRMNPPYTVDATAAWLAQMFGPAPLTEDELVARFSKLSGYPIEGPGEAVIPSFKDGQLVWVPGQPDPNTWWHEKWGDDG